MSSPNPIAAPVVAIFLVIFCAATGAGAQCPPAAPGPSFLPKVEVAKPAPAVDEPILPEAGFLSNTHYTSQFFGFSFDLPLTVQGHEIMTTVMPEKQHALLALQFEQGQQRGYISITATDPVPGFDKNIPEERQKEVESWARAGTQAGGLGLPVPQYLLRSNRFYHRINRRGRNYAAQYWTSINNYTVEVFFASNDEDFLRKAKQNMAEARFYCPQDDGTLITADNKPVKAPGQPYTGPTVPTLRVNAALHDQPGKDIPLGEVEDGVYRNPGIGFEYELPKGWKPLVTDPVDPPREATALREYRFLHACSQILLQAVPQQQQSDRPLEAAIVLRALDPNCLLMHTATSLTDKRTADEVAASLEELGEFGEIGSDELISTYGHLFMVFHGTIATSSRGEDLAARLSQTMAATRFNKLLLVWTFMASSSTALDGLPTGSITFEGSPAIQLHTAKSEKLRSASP